MNRKIKFSFAKRHYQSALLNRAFERILPLTLNAAVDWIYIDITTNDTDPEIIPPRQPQIFSLRFSGVDIANNGNELFSVECGDFQEFEKSDDFLREIAQSLGLARTENPLPGCLRSEFLVIQKPEDFYVYRHIFTDGRIYIGKGKGGRILDFINRNGGYLGARKNLGDPHVFCVAERLSEADAYALEFQLIRSLSRVNNKSPGVMLNSTEGRELADIGDMPIRTILKLFPDWPPKGLDQKYLDWVNIYWRRSEDRGSARSYNYNLPIFKAARMIDCTMNEIVGAVQNGLPAKIYDHWLMTAEDVNKAREIP